MRCRLPSGLSPHSPFATLEMDWLVISSGFGAFPFCVRLQTALPSCCDCPICAPRLSVRYDRPVIDARAPSAVPASETKQRRRMSSVILPQASAGAALFGRAVLGRLNDASHLAPLRGEPSPCGFASLCRQRDNGAFVQWEWCVARTAMG